MFNKRGFTLVEILIVMSIIALLAALAIPGLLRARHNATESVAINSLRMISGGCESFRAAQITPSYPENLTTLTLTSPPYLDAVLATGTRQCYIFSYTTDTEGYYCIASPQNPGSTGTRYFYVDEKGIIHNSNTAITDRATGQAAAPIQ